MTINPWNNISLEIYESHMSLEDIAQLQALNRIMREQVKACPYSESAAVLGVAGGNGLEHCLERFGMVYGIDVNPAYLEVCAKRFSNAVGKQLLLEEMDLLSPESVLPEVELIIADLLIEYIGTEIFCEKTLSARARYVSCVIQGPDNARGFVSESPYLEAFQNIGELHRDVDERELTGAMDRYGYSLVYRESCGMPNGKSLIRLDYWLKGKREKNSGNYTK